MPQFIDESLILTNADFSWIPDNSTLDKNGQGFNVDLIEDRTNFHAGGISPDGFFCIARYKVPDGIAIALGTPNADETFFCHFEQTDDTEILGRIRIVAHDPTGYNSRPTIEAHTSEMTESKPYDKKVNPTPPLKMPWVLDKGFITVWFKPDIDDQPLNTTHADHKLIVPITKRYGMARRLMGK